ncbi:MAG TPA: PPOX class F420-dependent oxidoreductase [Miltoncostaeaceae bacterium]|nr:PPOX class F420-dependent oxidoreductase [Miltoncostaeaceae bacterium]
MPPTPVPAVVAAVLRGPNPAVIASVRADGSPHSTATWYDWEDGRVLLSMDDSRLRLRFLRHDPRVSLTVLDAENWYRHITLTGRIAELYPDRDLVDIDRLAHRYRGEPYGNRTAPRTSAWMSVDAWHGWDGNRPFTAE